MFVRGSSGTFVRFSTKKESTRLAASSPFFKKPNKKRASSGKKVIATCPSPASSSSTLTNVLQASSAPVVQETNPTLRDGPVVASRPPA